MVVPVRDIGNKFFLSSANTNSQQTMTLLTISLSTNMGMDLSYKNLSNNYDEMRDRTSSSKPQSSRASSMSSTKFSVVYHERMKNNNNLEDINMESFDSPQLSYVIPKK